MYKMLIMSKLSICKSQKHRGKRVDRADGGHPFRKIHTPARVCEFIKKGVSLSAVRLNDFVHCVRIVSGHPKSVVH